MIADIHNYSTDLKILEILADAYFEVGHTLGAGNEDTTPALAKLEVLIQELHGAVRL